MPGLVVNTEGALEARKPIEPGEYHVTLTGHRVNKAKSEDKFPFLTLEMTVHEDEQEYAGRKLFRNLSASPDALWAMVDAAVAFGADIEELTAPAVDMDAVFTDLRGNDAYVRTDNGEYKGQVTNTVEKILAEPTL